MEHQLMLGTPVILAAHNRLAVQTAMREFLGDEPLCYTNAVGIDPQGPWSTICCVTELTVYENVFWWRLSRRLLSPINVGHPWGEGRPAVRVTISPSCLEVALESAAGQGDFSRRYTFEPGAEEPALISVLQELHDRLYKDEGRVGQLPLAPRQFAQLSPSRQLLVMQLAQGFVTECRWQHFNTLLGPVLAAAVERPTRPRSNNGVVSLHIGQMTHYVRIDSEGRPTTCSCRGPKPCRGNLLLQILNS